MITSIRLQNFRSYIDESFEFDEGVNIIVGPNASGKTNLLEAVLILARGKSFKAKDAEVVNFKFGWARLDGQFGHHMRIAKIKLDDNGVTQKSFELDDKPCLRLGLDRTVPVVLFEPDHLQMLVRGPSERREYLDDLLERSQPGFKKLNANYRRTLAQRNALLKGSHAQARPQLFAWDVRLSELGSQIAVARDALITDINKQLSKTYSKIAGRRATASVQYQSFFPVKSYADKMLSKLESSVSRDFERGFTAYGPHREDILFLLNTKPLNQTGSRGEARSLLLALKIFELGLIKKTSGAKPIFLLDDVFSELDSARRRALVDYLKDHQAIITTTDADAVIEYFSNNHNLIPLQKT